MPQTINAMPTTYATFQMTEVAVLRDLSRCILELTGNLRLVSVAQILRRRPTCLPVPPTEEDRPGCRKVSRNGAVRQENFDAGASEAQKKRPLSYSQAQSIRIAYRNIWADGPSI